MYNSLYSLYYHGNLNIKMNTENKLNLILGQGELINL